MIALSIAIIFSASLAYNYFIKKLELSKPIPQIPLNEQVTADMQILRDRMTSLETMVGLTRR